MVTTDDINCNVFSIMVNFKDIMINMETQVGLGGQVGKKGRRAEVNVEMLYSVD